MTASTVRWTIAFTACARDSETPISPVQPIKSVRALGYVFSPVGWQESVGKLFLKLFISLMVVTAAANWVYEQVSVGDVSCEARYMARAVANFVRNALRYAKKTIEVTVQQSANKTYINVDDDGPGIPLAERERVFEPFTRLDQSRDRASGGVGLGLAIAMQVAKWHRGGVSVSDSPLGGARVTISW